MNGMPACKHAESSLGNVKHLQVALYEEPPRGLGLKAEADARSVQLEPTNPGGSSLSTNQAVSCAQAGLLPRSAVLRCDGIFNDLNASILFLHHTAVAKYPCLCAHRCMPGDPWVIRPSHDT